MGALWNDVMKYVNNHQVWVREIGWDIVKIIVLFILIRIGIGISNRLVKRTLKMRQHMDEQRKETMEALFGNIIRYIFYFVFILTVLPIFGIHIAALLAGAGVAGIAIAFAAQALLKDFFNGFFILMENQFGVGDNVVINNVWGSVKAVGLRITTIQVWTGQVVTIPNGEIKQVINYSKENSFADIQVNIGYNSDVEKALGIVERVMNELAEEHQDIVGEASVLGVQELNDWNYTIRAIAECKPYTHWGVQRMAKQRLRVAFTKEGIDLPIQKIVYRPEGKLPDSFNPEEPVQPTEEP